MGGQETIYRDYVDISVAVATPKGLVVPVLRNVERMNYADVEKGIAELGKKAKNNQISIEDMDGGTFTISNGGVFGSLFGTPIINPPQSAILGMHGVFERPVVRNGQVVIRPMMYIALTYDHRLVDGREAVTFLLQDNQERCGRPKDHAHGPLDLIPPYTTKTSMPKGAQKRPKLSSWFHVNCQPLYRCLWSY